MTGAYRAQNRFAGKHGGGFDGGCDAHADQYRWTGIDRQRGDVFKDEFHHAFVAFGRHQHFGTPWQRATAARHINFNFRIVAIGNNLPGDPRHAAAGVFAGIHFVEDFDRVMA